MQIKPMSRVLWQADLRREGKYSHILENKRINAKSPRQIEKIIKGVSNHRRIEILMLVAKQKGITLEKIAEQLECNIKTVSGHTHKLLQAGLIEKKYLGQSVLHSLSPLGKHFHTFLRSF